ncbi:MAG TPA: response regulator [Candidatus Dormibacteraeota bacterium]
MFKVLLVEDDEAVVEMYRLQLSADGYVVVVASDGEEGLAMALAETPDFIFLDLRLPKLSGFELLARIRANARTRDIPVIVLSNLADPELSHRRDRLGVVEFMIKAETTPLQLSQRLAEHERRRATDAQPIR